MTIKNLEELRNSGVSRIAEHYLNKARHGGYVCPSCGNGSGKDSTGANFFINSKTNAENLKCHKCGNKFNALDLVATVEHLNLKDYSDLMKAAQIVGDINGLIVEVENYPYAVLRKGKNLKALRPTKVNTEPETARNDSKLIELIHSDIESAKENLPKLFEEIGSDKFRGLTATTLSRFKCGYVSEWIHPKNRLEDKKVRPSRRLIIPTQNHYDAVMLPADRTNENKSYWKMHAGTREFFGFYEMWLNAEIVLVVEGEIDAMSIYQATEGKYPVIAVGSASVSDTVVEQLKARFEGIEDKPKFLVLFDCDETGRAKAPKFCAKLIENGIPAVCKFMFDDVTKTDFNNILIEEGDIALADKVNNLLSDAQSEFDSVEKEIADNFKFNKKIKAWQEHNGVIDPGVLDKLKCAIKKIDDVLTDNMTAEIAQDTEILSAAAMCDYYGFSITKFLKAVKDSADCKDIVSVADVRNKIKKYVKNIETEHEEGVKKLRIQSSIKKRDERLERIKYLYTLPQSKERDQEIIDLIRKMCEWNNHNNKRPTIANTFANAELIFTYDPVLCDLIGYEEFRQSEVFIKQPIWRKYNAVNENWEDTDDKELSYYLRKNYLEFNSEKIMSEFIVHLSRENSYHEIQQVFEKLPEWDKVPRAERMFVKFLNVTDNEYTRAVTMNWLFGAVARIYYPGCNYQTALGLCGEQGIGKSRILHELGGKWHGDIPESLDDPHALDTLRELWIAEIAEYAAARKAEMNAQKAMISRSADTRRVAYAKRAKTFKRQNVFAITCNDKEFLRDKTGNRRYLLLECHSKKNDSSAFDEMTDLKGYFKQIWAEVYFKFKEMTENMTKFNNDMLRLPAEIQKQAEEIAKDFTVDDGLNSEIPAFLDKLIPCPQIWEIMTKEQRRKFFLENQIEFKENEFENRIKMMPDSVKKDELLVIISDDKNKVKEYGGVYISSTLDSKYIFYGFVKRQEVTAIEINNECFNNRQTVRKINEVLERLDGWKIKRDSKYSLYGIKKDVKNVYCRVENKNEDKPSEPVNNSDFNGVAVSDSDIPDTVKDSTEPFDIPSHSVQSNIVENRADDDKEFDDGYSYKEFDVDDLPF